MAQSQQNGHAYYYNFPLNIPGHSILEGRTCEMRGLYYFGTCATRSLHFPSAPRIEGSVCTNGIFAKARRTSKTEGSHSGVSLLDLPSVTYLTYWFLLFCFSSYGFFFSLTIRAINELNNFNLSVLWTV